MRIEAGSCAHPSPLGTLMLDRELPAQFVETMCSAMSRARLLPPDCHAVEVLGETGRFAFEVFDHIDWDRDEIVYQTVIPVDADASLLMGGDDEEATE